MALKTKRYSGKEKDATGLYYYGARYFDPTLMRWLSPDPIGPADGPNIYLFLNGNPVNSVDINGNNIFDLEYQALADKLAAGTATPTEKEQYDNMLAIPREHVILHPFTKSIEDFVAEVKGLRDLFLHDKITPVFLNENHHAAYKYGQGTVKVSLLDDMLAVACAHSDKPSCDIEQPENGVQIQRYVWIGGHGTQGAGRNEGKRYRIENAEGIVGKKMMVGGRHASLFRVPDKVDTDKDEYYAMQTADMVEYFKDVIKDPKAIIVLGTCHSAADEIIHTENIDQMILDKTFLQQEENSYATEFANKLDQPERKIYAFKGEVGYLASESIIDLAGKKTTKDMSNRFASAQVDINKKPVAYREYSLRSTAIPIKMTK